VPPSITGAYRGVTSQRTRVKGGPERAIGAMERVQYSQIRNYNKSHARNTNITEAERRIPIMLHVQLIPEQLSPGLPKIEAHGKHNRLGNAKQTRPRSINTDPL
jgi:hypothetical protein